MAAFAGAFVAAIAAVVTWRTDAAATQVAARRTPAHRPVAVVLPKPSPSVPAPSPSPSPAPVPSPAHAAAPTYSAAAPAVSRPAPPKPSGVVIGSYQQELINQDRAQAGLPPLTWSSCLAGIAQQQAARMAAQGSISHTDGISEDLGCGLGGYAGENLGYWTGGVNDAQLNSMFMASPEHRANILGNFRYVGTCWATAPNGTAYLAVEFES